MWKRWRQPMIAKLASKLATHWWVNASEGNHGNIISDLMKRCSFYNAEAFKKYFSIT